MIDKKLAESIKALALDCVRKLDASVKDAIDNAPEQHASMYRRLVGKVMGQIFTEILTPIYVAYPDLEPEELRRARLDAGPVVMPPETGAKLMEVSSSVSTALSNLREDLAQKAEGDVRSLGLALEGTISHIKDIQEFLRRASPRMDH